MKPIYKSRTLWANVLAIALIVAQTLTDNQVIPVEYQTVILAVINGLLRYVTTEAVSLK